MVSKASIRAKRVDHSSFKSDSSFLNVSSTDTLLGEEATEATDYTGPTTLTCDGSIKTSLLEDFFSFRSL